MSISALIVDDSLLARSMMRAAIVNLRPDWDIHEAKNGDAALELVDETIPDLAFVDVNMPGIDGLELVSRFRTRFPDMAIALVTANVQSSTREHGANHDVPVIGKPIESTKLADFLSSIGH